MMSACVGTALLNAKMLGRLPSNNCCHGLDLRQRRWMPCLNCLGAAAQEELFDFMTSRVQSRILLLPHGLVRVTLPYVRLTTQSCCAIALLRRR